MVIEGALGGRKYSHGVWEQLPTIFEHFKFKIGRMDIEFKIGRVVSKWTSNAKWDIWTRAYFRPWPSRTQAYWDPKQLGPATRDPDPGTRTQTRGPRPGDPDLGTRT